MKLEVIYEDNHIIVVYKEAGILSQEDITKDPDLLTITKKYIKDKYNKPGEVYLGLVHRLDRMTSGVMVFARTSKAASRLSEQIRNKEFKKTYYAVVEKSVSQTTPLVLVDKLIKDEKLVKSFVSDNGLEAKLDYTSICCVDNQTLLKVNLHTGRHHQIRVQLSSRNMPIVGDVLYGSKTKCNLMLCASELEFIHPTLKTKLNFKVLPKGKEWNKFLNNVNDIH